MTRSLYLASLAVAFSCVALSCLAVAGCSSCKKPGHGDRGTSERTGPLTPGAAVSIPTARAAYVTNNGSDSISVLDRDGDVVTTVSVDLEPDAREAPHHLAIDVADRRLFVALAFPPPPNTEKRKDPHASHGAGSDLGRLARLDLGSLAVTDAVDVDENPGDVVLTHDRARVLVTHFDMKRAMDVAARGELKKPEELAAVQRPSNASGIASVANATPSARKHSTSNCKDSRWRLHSWCARTQ